MPPQPSQATGLSACVIAKDEADRIDECLGSLAFCDEILVVDAALERRHARGRRGARRARDRARLARPRCAEGIRDPRGAPRLGAVRRRRRAHLPRAAPPRSGACATRASPAAPAARLPRLLFLSRALDPPRHLVPRSAAAAVRSPPRALGRDATRTTASSSTARPARCADDLLHHPYRSLEDHLATIDRYTTTMAERARTRRAAARGSSTSCSAARALPALLPVASAASSTAGAACCSPRSRPTTCGSSTQSCGCSPGARGSVRAPHGSEASVR